MTATLHAAAARQRPLRSCPPSSCVAAAGATSICGKHAVSPHSPMWCPAWHLLRVGCSAHIGVATAAVAPVAAPVGAAAPAAAARAVEPGDAPPSMPWGMCCRCHGVSAVTRRPPRPVRPLPLPATTTTTTRSATSTAITTATALATTSQPLRLRPAHVRMAPLCARRVCMTLPARYVVRMMAA